MEPTAASPNGPTQSSEAARGTPPAAPVVGKSHVTLREFYERHKTVLGLKLLAGEAGLSCLIREPTVNRPGLALAGFTKYFAKHRLQVVGSAEWHFLKSLKPEIRKQRYDTLMAHRFPGLVFCRGHRPDPLLLECAEENRVPILQSPLVTMKFINQATIHLEEMFAPTALEMGSMVDILGIGVVIRGESGIGKSECVLALIERGYSLVADDITRLTLSGGSDVIGTCPELTRDHMEVRGLGILDIPAMFGVRSIRTNKRVDLVVSLKPWEKVPDVDRVGIESERISLLGIPLPHVTIPVRPGRDIARLVEVAAFLEKLRMTGKNPAQSFNERLIAHMKAEKA